MPVTVTINDDSVLKRCALRQLRFASSPTTRGSFTRRFDVHVVTAVDLNKTAVAANRSITLNELANELPVGPGRPRLVRSWSSDLRRANMKAGIHVGQTAAPSGRRPPCEWPPPPLQRAPRRCVACPRRGRGGPHSRGGPSVLYSRRRSPPGPQTAGES